MKKETKEQIIGLSMAYLGILLITLDAINGWYITNIILGVLGK